MAYFLLYVDDNIITCSSNALRRRVISVLLLAHLTLSPNLVLIVVFSLPFLLRNVSHYISPDVSYLSYDLATLCVYDDLRKQHL